MSKIDTTQALTALPAQFSPAAPPTQPWAAEIIAQRIARAEAIDPPIGRSILIVPALLAVIALGWFLPLLAILGAAAPLVALILAVADRFQPQNPTDAWHGR